MARRYLVGSKDGVRVSLKVSPAAKSSELKGLYGERSVKLSVAAPPERGRANAEVERILARLLGVGTSEVEVIRGASGRDKVALVRGISEKRVGEVLDLALGG